ncbi:hypothetical protein PENSPDRAFT_663302 [Peniophora sp. CONT]|nr:hypothetical protein PENSPDRAFT_663302 [Peniophora sp. CONT]
MPDDHEPRIDANGACAAFSRFPLEIQEIIFLWSVVIDPPVSALRRRKSRKPLHAPSDVDNSSDSDSEIYRLRSSSKRDEPQDVPGSLGFVKISHVCSMWRAILLSMKRVWAENIGVLPRATTDMILRAGSYPITITLQDLALRDNFDEYLTPKAPVIRGIRGTFSKANPNHLRTFASGLLHSTLEVVDLSVMDCRARRLDDAVCTPSLRCLRLQNIFIPFITGSLKYLAITFKSSKASHTALSIPIFLSMLRNCCGALQELKLIHCFGLDFTPWAEPIQCPVLQSLDVGGYSSTLLDTFQDCFAYPSTCDVAFHALTDHGVRFGEPHNALCRALRIFSDEVTARSGSYGFEFNTLLGETPYISVRPLSSESSTGQGDLFIKHAGLGFRRVYFDPAETQDGADVFEALEYALYCGDHGPNLSALGKLRVLSVIHTDPTDRRRDGKKQVLRKMSELRVLHLHGFDRDTMFDICGTSGRAMEPILPNIEVLRISAGYPSAPPIHLGLFCTCLWRRAERGQPKGQPYTLPSLIVAHNVEFDVSLEEQKLEVEDMKEKRWVEKVVWKE